jgi:hypothetical protein
MLTNISKTSHLKFKRKSVQQILGVLRAYRKIDISNLISVFLKLSLRIPEERKIIFLHVTSLTFRLYMRT